MNIAKIAATATTALLLLNACKGSGTSQEGSANDPVVARVGAGAITVSEFRARMEEQPPLIRARYGSMEMKKEFLDNLVRFEVLAQEARRQGLEKDPEFQAAVEKLLVQRLVQKQATSAVPAPPSDEEVRKYYQEHLTEFSRPEKVRVSQVFLASAEGDPKRGAVKAEADKLLADVRKQESGPVKTAFGEQVRKRSDDAASRDAGGDLGLLTREELAARWGQPVADAAFGLQTLSEVGLVASPRGLHLLKLVARQPGFSQTVDQVKPRIESRLMADKRAKSMDDLVAGLMSKTKVEVDDKVLGGLSVDKDGLGVTRPSP
ncbi:peptidyl-prolyl cis-trans isomerase [Corallococcus exiguus]|uniref:peptidyl-prolyl cis-trans isomerase n=1 Tax=Corallococcus exiguus TaxID=83462 RepID=UPI0014940F02|nr:peptidyl-prolyl cis-trans isomerase [Corallococcus exiguus]NPD22680.1 peptidylprolyl isomerase [Corallococcus exiguus]